MKQDPVTKVLDTGLLIAPTFDIKHELNKLEIPMPMCEIFRFPTH